MNNGFYSAVDAHVAKYILEECLSKQLKDKTRVLITHKLESLKYVDYIYIFKNGEIVAQGNFEEIKQTSVYQEIEENVNKETKEEEEDTEVLERKASSRKSSSKEVQEIERKKSQRKETSYHEGKEQKEMMDKLMLTEDRQTGAVTFAVWKAFFDYFESYLYLFGMFIAIFCWLGFRTATDFWLAHWSNSAEGETDHGNGFYYGIYVTFLLGANTLLFCRMAMAVIGCLGVSKKLHTDMFSRIIRAPINLFFDRVPLGRLLNRFATDLNVVDLQMPFAIARISIPFDITWKLILCGIVGTIWVIPLACVFVFLCAKLQKKYFSVYREAFRLCKIYY